MSREYTPSEKVGVTVSAFKKLYERFSSKIDSLSLKIKDDKDSSDLYKEREVDFEKQDCNSLIDCLKNRIRNYIKKGKDVEVACYFNGFSVNFDYEIYLINKEEIDGVYAGFMEKGSENMIKEVKSIFDDGVVFNMESYEMLEIIASSD